MEDIVSGLIRAGKRFDARGWVLGTSGNFSVVIARDPLRLAITRSGTHKGELAAADFLELDGDGMVVAGDGRPSAETALHTAIVAARGKRRVVRKDVHTFSGRSIWGEEAMAFGMVCFVMGGLLLFLDQRKNRPPANPATTNFWRQDHG